MTVYAARIQKSLLAYQRSTVSGKRDDYHTELIDFDVARIGLPYNAILGYPTLQVHGGDPSGLQQSHQDAGQRWHNRCDWVSHTYVLNSWFLTRKF